jgi:hypothetical protein
MVLDQSNKSLLSQWATVSMGYCLNGTLAQWATATLRCGEKKIIFTFENEKDPVRHGVCRTGSDG